MTTAIITFTAKLNMDLPIFTENMTDEEKLQGWLSAARIEPHVAMEALDFEITGEIINENV